MNLKEYRITPEEIKIDPLIIADLLGIDETLPEPYASIIDREIKSIHNYDHICGGLRIIEKVEMDFSQKKLILEETSFSVGQQVFRYLKNSERIVLFVCTAGEQVSLRSRELTRSGQLVEGYVCDVTGSVLVEQAMSIIHNRFNEDLKKSKNISTNRYSPGYCDWNVEEQHKLFKFFPHNFCGISLSESALMYPVKSISGIFGIGKNVRFHKYRCNACSSINCIYRNRKYTFE